MRPLAVLIFILGAVSALVFAFVSVSPDGSRAYAGDRPTDSVTGPAEGPVAQPGALEERDEIVAQAPQLGDTGPRTVVESGEGGGYLNEIQGIVRTHEGIPLEGAIVKLASASGTSQIGTLAAIAGNPRADTKAKRRTKTNAEGKYRFSNVEPGNDWALIASHPDHGHRRVSGVDVPEEGRIEEIIDLLPGFRIFGRVRDKDSRRAIADAVVSLEDPLSFLMPAKKRNEKKKEVVSDAQGFYEFKNVSRDNPLLICTAEGFATQIHNNVQVVGKREKQMELNFEMIPGLPIAGRVVGPDLSGITDVHIDAVCHAGDFSCRGETLSTEDGEFLIADLAEGVYTLRVTAAGWDCDPYVRIEAGTTDVTIQLFEQGLVAGKVIDGATGRPVSDFRILVRVDHPTSEIHGPVKSQKNFRGSADGSFEVAGLSQGTYLIQADAPGFASSFSEGFTITQGLTTSDVTVRMRKGGTLVGAVHDSYSGAPIAGASVSTHENNWIDSEFTRLLSGTMPMPLTLKTVKTGVSALPALSNWPP